MPDPYDNYDPENPSTVTSPLPANGAEATQIGNGILVNSLNDNYRPIKRIYETYDFVDTALTDVEMLEDIIDAHQESQNGTLVDSVTGGLETFFSIVNLGTGSINTVGADGLERTIGQISSGLADLLRKAREAYNDGGSGGDDGDSDGDGDNDDGDSDSRGNDTGRYPPERPPTSKDPLLLDLDGDGLELLAPADGVYFDIDNDGFEEHVSWVQPDDGILARDLNSNGLIDSSAELFGTDTATGHQHLTQYDLDSNGRIDSNDQIFDQLLVWRDLNSDGISQTGELAELASIGISSISLTTSAMSLSTEAGTIIESGTVLRTDGTQFNAYSVNLLADQVDSIEVIPAEFVLNSEVRLLPKIRGLGTMSDLSVAMTRDPELLILVKSFCLTLASLTAEQAVQSVQEILFKWAGVEEIDPLSRGADVDARAISVVETITGISYPAVISEGGRWGQPLEEYYNQLLNGLTARLVSQAWASDMLYKTANNPFALITAGVLFNPTILLTAYAIEDGQTLDQNVAINITSLGAALDVESSNFAQAPLNQLIVPLLRLMAIDRYGSIEDAQVPLMRLLANIDDLDIASAGVGWAAVMDGSMLSGSSGDDSLQGGAADLYVAAGDGDDVVVAGTGGGLMSLGGGNDQGTGSGQSDLIFGEGGDDVITAGNGKDVIVGGAGADDLDGGDDSDAYVWAHGDGSDTITETINNGTADELLLEGVDPASVAIGRSGTLILTIAESAPGAGNGGTITMADSFDGEYEKGVEQVAFDDGTTWTHADLRGMWLASVTTAGSDSISGFDAADTIRGGAGNDMINGGDGGDTYVWARGDGSDTITETINNGTADKLVLEGVDPASVAIGRSGGTLILTIAESAPGIGDGGTITMADSFDGEYEKGVEQIAFDDGTVWTDSDLRLMWLAATSTSGNDTITGFNTADTIRGGASNDTINGGDGSDTYLWARGDGSDTITESNNNGTADSLVLEGINPGDVSLSRNGDSVTLLVSESASGAGNGGSILLVGVLDSAYEHGVEQIRFADGTVWTQATLRLMVVTAAGTAGNDTIAGTASADWLRGAAGNDTINGGDGSDTYLWARGDGSDTLTETINNGGADTLVLEGINPADVTIGRSGGTLILTIASSAPGAGDGGVITMADSFDGSYEKGFERIAFGDGTVWTDADVRAHWLALAPTSGNDTIAGFTSADVIRGGAGNDTLNGGDGADQLYGDEGADTLSGGNSSDSLFGGAGNDFLYGNDGNDTLAGGTGNERLEGGSGVDTYIYNVGDGDDVIYDASYDSSPDETLIFGEGISAESLVFTRSTADVDDLIISFSGFAGSIVLDEQFKNAGVELFRFSDGSTMTEDQAYALAASGGGGSGSAMMTSQDPTSPDFGIAMLGFARPSLWLEVPEVV